MFSRLSRLIVLLAAVQILGGHWIALQSAAWIGMIAEYERGSTLGQALVKTFDGEHPCALCQVVKMGQAEEKKQESVKALVKLEAVLAVLVQVPAPEASDWEFAVLARVETARSHAPPTPPPLAA